MVSFALTVVDEIPDLLPADLRTTYDVLDVATALRWIHAPDDWGQVGAARKRFRFEEALTTQLVLVRRRAAVRAQGARARAGGGGLLAAFDQRLPFELTQGQRDVGAQLETDLAEPHPMNRLLQGEVGSGKTLVALRAMLRVIDSGGQAALLAPTEVLAQQHHRSISAMLGDLAAGGMLGGADEGTNVALLTGSMNTAQRREAMLRIASGEAGIVIGTHALLEDRVSFADLGLVVVDEQHRFGVEQRAALTDKAQAAPHVLVMTATPIPRTVAMTVFGDLEVSTLRELPAGRAPIQTNVVPLKDQPHWRDRVWQRVREEVEKGHQVYVVCPRIVGDDVEEGESDQRDLTEEGTPLPAVREGSLAAVESLAPELAEGPLAGLRVGMLHGRMAPEAKDRAMQDFARGDVDVLVATTVIEVGVDVAQRHHHRAARRRPVRRLPAPPAPRPGRPRRPARAVPAGQPCRAGQPGDGPAAGGGRHDGRLRAVPHRPRAAPGGRRPRRQPVRPALQPRQPAGAPRREDHRRGPRRGRGDGRRRPDAQPLAAARRRGGRLGAGQQECLHGALMTRIIGGSAGGRRLTTPRGQHTRPTSDRVREALFSAIEAWCGSLSGLRFLDLYAGSGAVGLEARSRGAGVVTLVEQDRRTAALISGNVKTLGFGQVEVLAASVAGTLARTPVAPYDVVFLDPPYPLRERRRRGRAAVAGRPRLALAGGAGGGRTIGPRGRSGVAVGDRAGPRQEVR